MIALEQTFKSGAGGFANAQRTFTQLARNEKFAVYERSFDGKVEGHEVFAISILKKGTQVFDKVVEDDMERYPSNNTFGKSAWCIGGKDSYTVAMLKYEALIKGAIAIENDSNEESEETTTDAIKTPTVPHVKGKRGRPAHTRPAIKIPNTARFTMSELVDLNKEEGWSQPLIYVDIQKRIESGVMKTAGVVEREPGQRGKPAVYYSLA